VRRLRHVGHSNVTLKTLKSAGLSIALLACSKGPCVTEPCPLPMAITINVTSGASGAPLTSAFANLALTGGGTESLSCDAGECFVPGTAATYNLTIGAPGFQSVQRTVVVQGSNPGCGCASVTSQHLEIALVPGS
jgi:hypothetical protein